MFWYSAVHCGILWDESFALLYSHKFTIHAVILAKIVLWSLRRNLYYFTHKHKSKPFFQGIPRTWYSLFPIPSISPAERMQIRVAGQEAEILCQTWNRISILCIKMQSGWKAAHALKPEGDSEDGEWKTCTCSSGLTAQKARLVPGCIKSSTASRSREGILPLSFFL